MYAINLNSENRILRATEERFADSESYLVESLPTGESEKEKDISNWKYINSQYVYDPLPDPEPQPEPIDIGKLDAQVLYTALMTDTLIEEDE